MKNYKMKEVKILKNGQAISEITVAENDVYRIFSIYAKKKLGRTIEDIIKVDLPSDTKSANVVLKNVLTVEDTKYVFLATTTGLMKHTDEETKGEVFFIKEEYKDFVTELKDILSLGKINNYYGKETCINKDILSRISLAFSDGDRVHMKGIKKAILPEMTYTYVNNYLQFAHKDLIENGKVVLDKNGEPKKVIDLDKFRLVEHPNKSVEHIAMDGSGFIMPHLIDEIGEKLGKQNLSWIGIREIGVASKGLLVRFDFKQYLRDEHCLNELFVKDMWGNTINIFDYDVLMNESQCKWAKWFDNYDEIESLINSNKYSKYRHLFEGFNIVKTSNNKIKDYTELNYQIVTNLALTPTELDDIAKETEESYRKIINKDIDAIRLGLGDISRDNKEILSATTKTHKLLQLDEKMVNIKSSKKVIESLVNKKVNTLAGGSIFVKGNYKVIIKDAISYIDSLVEQEYVNEKLVGRMSSKGLQDCQNYVPRELGKRVLARCPLNSATEIVKTELVNNSLYNKYFGNLSQDICFYSFNDFMMRQSGADEDLDLSMVIDNETIYNAVIDDIIDGDTYYFRNQFDGSAAKDIFNYNNYISSIVRARGNSIGKLSNKGAIISNLIQTFEEDTIDKKQSILDRFQKYKKYSYFTLYLQMKAIDSVKTNISVTTEETNVLKEITQGLKKPKYIYYAKYKSENKTVKYNDTAYTNSLLNNYCRRIIDDLGYKARELENNSFNNKYLHNYLKLDIELNRELFTSLKDLIELYHSKRNGLKVNVAITVCKDKIAKCAGSDLEMSLRDELVRLCEVRNVEFDLIDIEIAERYKEIISGYEAKDVLRALGEYRHNNCFVSTRFVIEFAFDELISYMKEVKKDSVKIYKEDENGDIRYLFKNYIKVDANISQESLVEQSLLNKKQKLGLIDKFRFGNLTYNRLTENVVVASGFLHNEQGELLGTVYPKNDGTVLEDGSYIIDRFDFVTKKNLEGKYDNAKSGAMYVNIAWGCE